MKKFFGFFLALQIALVMLFSIQSPAHAGWERDSYRYRHDMMNDYYWHHDLPFFWMIDSNNNFFAFAPLYKLAIDSILSILFIIFFSKFIMTIINRMKAHPIKNGYFGFTFLIIFPLISFVLLGLLWLGIALFLSYGLLFLIGVFLAKIFIGWGIMKKITNDYVLDWKAGIIGPLVVLILLYIPILGWLVLAIIISIATGALIQEVLPLLERQKLEHKATKK